MNELVTKIQFDPERLDKTKYTLSLAAEALRAGLCSEAEYTSLEKSIYDKLADHIILYTKGKATSVDNATAEQLLDSILYNTDFALMQLSPKIALNQLFKKPFDDIYYNGMRINREFTLKALAQLREVKRTRIDVTCVFYNTLLDETLGELICSNDVKFNAKRNFTSVDYYLPTVNESVCGISGILHMLDELQAENIFVNSFDKMQLAVLWERYMNQIANPVENKINLGQLVFEQSLLSLMAGNVEPILPLGESDAHKLAELSYKDEESDFAALNVSHRFGKRAPEKYISRLLTTVRAPFRAIFEGGEAAIRQFAGI